MDIINLIGKTPGLLESLKSYGLTSDDVAKVGGELTQQLRSDGQLDLTDLLTSLDVGSFAEQIDIGRLAQNVGIDAMQAEAVVRKIAPAIEAFTGDTSSSFGKLGNLAASLFGKQG